MGAPEKRRLRQVLKALKSTERESALIISSAPIVNRTHDLDHPFRQDSNFFYLTGSLSTDSILLLSTKRKLPTLYVKKRTAHMIAWEGAGDNPKKLERELNVEVRVSEDPISEVKKALQGTERLYYQNTPNSLGWSIAKELIELEPYKRRTFYPKEFFHLDSILAPLRLIKDRSEISSIKKATDLSVKVLTQVMSEAKVGDTERALATKIDNLFREGGAEPSFGTMAASGKSSSIIHYWELNKTVKRNEWILFDCGTELNLYASDMTRMIPAGKTFTPVQRDLYTVLLAAQKRAVSRVKPGADFRKITKAAHRDLVRGLIDLKILRGSVESHLKKNSLHKYMPHGLGHSLGIDVHDVGSDLISGGLPLEEGMVLTIEPGLYFPKKTKEIPASGIRIEDLILVTADGNQNLTEKLPKEVEEIEALRA